MAIFGVVFLVPLGLIRRDLKASEQDLNRLMNKPGAGSLQGAQLGQLASSVRAGTPGLARFTMAYVIFLILGMAITFLLLQNLQPEVTRPVLTTLAGLLASIVGFYFGNKAAQSASAAPSAPSAPAAIGTSAAPSGPSLVSITPAAEATNVAPGAQVEARFDRELDPRTVNESSFQLAPTESPGQPIAATVGYESSTRTATLAPSQRLTPGTHYRARITRGVQGTDGNPLLTQVSWGFTTSS